MVVIERLNFRGNPNIGIYAFATDRYAIIPHDADEKFYRYVTRILQVPVVKTSIGDTGLIGVLLVGNNNGLLLPSIAKEYEVLELKKSIDVNMAVTKSKFTALGNICLVNDKAALLHPEAYEELRHVVVDVLGVQVVEKGAIAGFPTVGSIAFVSSVVGIVHPEADEREVEFLSNLFGVPFDVGTVNFGVGFIKSGLVGNSKGILVGDRTTGPEIMRIGKLFGVAGHGRGKDI
jgi:translation initiation factor 6